MLVTIIPGILSLSMVSTKGLAIYTIGFSLNRYLLAAAFAAGYQADGCFFELLA